MNGLLFSLPGAPILYYGDEIGMGDNIYLGDRNGVRTPMQWSGDRNAGFSQANPQRLYLPVIMDPEYHYGTVNVEAQQNNPHSQLWWTRRLIALRKRYKAFAQGSIEFLFPENRKVLAFVRRYENETMLFVANLSRFVQYAELDLNQYKGTTPVELFGLTRFPPVGDAPYFLTLGPHAFYWFALEPVAVEPGGRRGGATAGSYAGTRRDNFRQRCSRERSEEHAGVDSAALPAVEDAGSVERRAPIQAVEITESIQVQVANGGPEAHLLLVRVTYLEGEPDTYLLTLAVASGQEAQRINREMPNSVIATVRSGESNDHSVLYDAIARQEICGVFARVDRPAQAVQGLVGRGGRFADRGLPQSPRRSRLGTRACANERRPEQLLGGLRRPPDPQTLPPS